MSPVRPRHLLVVLMAVALALITCVSLVVTWIDRHQSFTPLLVTIGVGVGWVGLGGCYLALGRQRLALRLGISTLTSLAAGAICAAAGAPPSYRVWCGLMFFANFVISTPLIYLWARGLRLTHPDHPPIEYWKSRRQFSLWGLLSATTCTAILLAVAMRLEFPVQHLYDVMVICVWGAVIPYVAGATLLSRIPIFWPLLAIPTSIVAVTFGIRSLGPGQFGIFQEFAAALASAVIVASWMLVLRIAGYYLHWPDYSAIETVGPSKRLVDEHGAPVELASPSVRLHEPPDGADSAQSNHSSEQSNLG